MNRDKNHHPNNFFNNWDNLKTIPFRDALIVHLKKYDQDRNFKAILFERMQFPKNIELSEQHNDNEDNENEQASKRS